MPRPKFRWLRLTPDSVVPGLLALEGLLLLAERFGWLTFDRHKGYAPLVTIAAVAAILLAMLLWFLIAIVFRRRFQFSLRSLMLLVVVVAIPCSWLSVELKAAREQNAAVEAIQKAGGWVECNEGYDPNGLVPVALLDGWQGFYFMNVTDVYFDEAKVGDSELEHLKGLPQLRFLALNGTSVSDAGLKHLKGFTQLESLFLEGTNVSDAGLEHLKGLTQLKTLDLSRTKVSDEGVRMLQKALPRAHIMNK